MQEKQEQEQGMMVMNVMQECPDVFDFNEIRLKLIRTNWNVQQVIQDYKSKNMIKLTLVDIEDLGVSIDMTFSRDGSGMDIISFLQASRPLNPGKEGYNIYRDMQKQDCINYLMLGNSIETLNLESLPISKEDYH